MRNCQCDIFSCARYLMNWFGWEPNLYGFNGTDITLGHDEDLIRFW